MSTASSADLSPAHIALRQGSLTQPHSGQDSPQSFGLAVNQAPKASPEKLPVHPNAYSPASSAPDAGQPTQIPSSTPSAHADRLPDALVLLTLHVAEDSSQVQAILTPCTSTAVTAAAVKPNQDAVVSSSAGASSEQAASHTHSQSDGASHAGSVDESEPGTADACA